MRMIDADAVKFSISGLSYISPYDYFALAEYFMKQVKAMPTLTPPNEWVSVDEKLPEPGRRVIASCGYFVGEAWLSVSGEWYRHDGFAWDNLDSDVTHWMPLPAPPDRRPPEGEE